MTYTEQIYEVFLSKIDDEFFGLLKPHIMRRQLHLYLIGAMVDFKECLKELKIVDYENEELSANVGDTEVVVNDILDSEIDIVGELTGKEYTKTEDFEIVPVKNQSLEFKIVFKNPLEEDVKIFKYNNGSFTEELSYEEIYILALGMVRQWIEPKRNKEENLKNVITDGAYKKLSSANMLDKVIKLSDRINEEYDRKRIDYTFNGFKGFD